MRKCFLSLRAEGGRDGRPLKDFVQLQRSSFIASFSVAPCLSGAIVYSRPSARIATGILKDLDGAAVGQVDDPTLKVLYGG